MSAGGKSASRERCSIALTSPSAFMRNGSYSPGSAAFRLDWMKFSRSAQMSGMPATERTRVSATVLFLNCQQFELQLGELRRNVDGHRPRTLHGVPMLSRLLEMEVGPAGLHGNLRGRRRQVLHGHAAHGLRDQQVHPVERADLGLQRNFADDLLLGDAR